MKIYVWAVVVGLALAYAIYGVATVDRRTDDERILSLIQETATAIENHDLSRTIAGVSRAYSDESGMTYDRLRVLAAQAMRAESTYRVTASPGPVSVIEDTANVQVKVSAATPGGLPIYKQTLNLELQRERGWRALFIPASVWRVTSAGNLGIDLTQPW